MKMNTNTKTVKQTTLIFEIESEDDVATFNDEIEKALEQAWDDDAEQSIYDDEVIAPKIELSPNWNGNAVIGYKGGVIATFDHLPVTIEVPAHNTSATNVM